MLKTITSMKIHARTLVRGTDCYNQVTLMKLTRLSSITMALLLGCLLAAFSASAQTTNVLITELMASNTHTLADEDGDFEDWIEIYNAGTNSVDLNGWYLHDSASFWQFPQTPLPPNGFLIVFASNKNRRVPGRPLHTNFKLDRSGEYLALLYPDAVTVAFAYSPSFPIQANDISYGLPATRTPVSLVSTGAPAKFLVPPASSMDTAWTMPGFEIGRAH